MTEKCCQCGRTLAEADARLIAAAPELLAAVTHLLRRIREDPAGVGYHAGFATEVFERAVRAYAKYTERSYREVQSEILLAQNAYVDREQELRMLRHRLEQLEESK